MLVLSLLAIQPLRRRFYSLMHWGHRMGSVVALVSLWFHILWEKSDDKKRNVVRLSLITGALVSNWLARLVVVVYNC